MNFLNDFGNQIRDLFASMTPAARIMGGLMVAVVVVSLGWIMNGGASGTKYEYLLGGRDYTDMELTSMEVAFGQAQLRDYERIGQRIKVPSETKDQYLKALNTSNSMPQNHNSPMEKALESGIFESNSIIDKRTVFAQQLRLENTIKKHTGIRNAFVSFDEQRAGFGRKANRVCTISVEGQNGIPVPQNLLRNFAKLATHTFAGLTMEDVTVTDLGTSSIIHGGSGDGTSAEENPFFAAQTQWESMYESKVSALLSDFQAKVAVNVVLDPTMRTQSEKLNYQQQPVAVSSSTLTKSSENSKAAPGGQPGAAPNGVSNQPTTLSASAAGQNSKLKETQENEHRLASHEASVTTVLGLIPKMVNVSIGIPESHYRKVALQKFRLNNPDKTDADAPVPTEAELVALRAEEEKAVRAAVETIPVGGREGDDRKAAVSVYSYIDLPTPEMPEPTLSENAFAWLAGSWSTLALIALVLVSLGMMFSWLKSPVTAGSTDKRFADGFGLEIPAIPIDQLDIASEGGATGAGGTDADGRRRPPALEVTGQEMKEDLSTIIKENPDAAVNLIKAWIGEAA
jgi:flagellar M-ring protein FliF